MVARAGRSTDRGDVAGRDAMDLQRALDRSRRAERVGWAAIALVLGLGLLAVLGVCALVVLFCYLAIRVTT